jgi:hypothetical protein
MRSLMEEAEEDCRDRQTLGTYLVWKIAGKAANFNNCICLHNFYLLLSYSYHLYLVQQVRFQFYSILFKDKYLENIHEKQKNYQKSHDGFAVCFYLVSDG